MSGRDAVEKPEARSIYCTFRHDMTRVSVNDHRAVVYSMYTNELQTQLSLAYLTHQNKWEPDAGLTVRYQDNTGTVATRETQTARGENENVE